MEKLWEYKDGIFQSKEPVLVASMGGKYDIWYDVSDYQVPTAKQIVALEEFCSIKPCNLAKQFIKALNTFADKMSSLPKEEIPGFGPSYCPQTMEKAANETAAFLRSANKSLGEISDSVFMCDSLVIPLQEYAPCRFILMNFEVKRGKVLGQSYGYEMEALFCDGQLLLVGENSGLWTRLEWENEFNIADFNIKNACPVYWR